jgi:polyisoprenyl-phosphate glycosyltransferase
MSAPVVTLVVPCYNEESVLPHTMGTLHQLLEKLMK